MLKLLIFGLFCLHAVLADEVNKCRVETQEIFDNTDIYCNNLKLDDKELPLDGPVPQTKIVHVNFLHCTGKIDENSFPKLRGVLTSMNINGGDLEKFVLPEMPKLTYLEIGDSKIPSLNGALKNAKNLESVSFRKDTFEIKEGDLDGLEKLESFRSTKVKVQLTKRLLQDLRKLETLMVTKGRLEKVPSDAFQNNQEITILELDDSSITTIEPGTFDNLQKLDRLDLRSTGLQSPFDVNLTKDLKKLNSLGIPARSVKGLDLKKLLDNCPKLFAFSFKKNDASCPEVKALFEEVEKSGRFMGVSYISDDSAKTC
uniref:Slit homolog 1 protein-like isoform X1 n=1 Tax=Diabrotica virgifera virgifera TaxID=50390 RepID=A0A6P7G464_DIAVI